MKKEILLISLLMVKKFLELNVVVQYMATENGGVSIDI